MPKPVEKSAIIEEPVAELVENASEPIISLFSNTQATRVETFSEGGLWGYRAVDNNGTVVKVSNASYATNEAALQAAHEDRGNDHLSFPDATTSRAWR